MAAAPRLADVLKDHSGSLVAPIRAQASLCPAVTMQFPGTCEAARVRRGQPRRAVLPGQAGIVDSPDALSAINEALLAKAAGAKLLCTTRVRGKLSGRTATRRSPRRPGSWPTWQKDHGGGVCGAEQRMASTAERRSAGGCRAAPAGAG